MGKTKQQQLSGKEAKPGITKIKKTKAKTLGSLSRKGDMQEWGKNPLYLEVLYKFVFPEHNQRNMCSLI